MKKNFIRAHPKNMQKFMAVFVETQAFSNFVTDAAMLHFHGHGSSPSKTSKKVDLPSSSISYQRESDIEILNQCIQTADVSEGMLLDALCRYAGAEPSMMPAAPEPLEMCGVGRAMEEEKAASGGSNMTTSGARESTALRANIFNVLADANYVKPQVVVGEKEEEEEEEEEGGEEEELELMLNPNAESGEAAAAGMVGMAGTAGTAAGDVTVTLEQKFDAVKVGDSGSSSTFMPDDSEKVVDAKTVADNKAAGQGGGSPSTTSARTRVSSKTSPVQTRKPDWVRRTSQMVTLLNPNLDMSRSISRAVAALSLPKLDEDEESSEEENSSEGEGVAWEEGDEGGEGGGRRDESGKKKKKNGTKKTGSGESKSSNPSKQSRYARQRAGTSLGSVEFGSGDDFTPRTRVGSRRRGSFQGGVKSKHALARIRTVSTAMVGDGKGGVGRAMTSSLASLGSLNSSLHSITESRDDLDDLLASKDKEQFAHGKGRRRSSSDADLIGAGRRRSSSEASSGLAHLLRPLALTRSKKSDFDASVESGGSGGRPGPKKNSHQRQLSQMIVNLDEHAQNNKRRISASLSLASLAESVDGEHAAVTVGQGGGSGGSGGDDEREFLSGHIDSVAVMNRRSPSSSVDL